MGLPFAVLWVVRVTRESAHTYKAFFLAQKTMHVHVALPSVRECVVSCLRARFA